MQSFSECSYRKVALSKANVVSLFTLLWTALQIFVVGWAFAASAKSQLRPITYWFSPLVVTQNQVDEVLLEVKVGGSVEALDHVELKSNWQSSPIKLHDDGTRGDLSPDDQIFTVKLSAKHLARGIKPKHVNRKYIGSLVFHETHFDKDLGAFIWVGTVTGHISETEDSVDFRLIDLVQNGRKRFEYGAIAQQHSVFQMPALLTFR